MRATVLASVLNGSAAGLSFADRKWTPFLLNGIRGKGVTRVKGGIQRHAEGDHFQQWALYVHRRRRPEPKCNGHIPERGNARNRPRRLPYALRQNVHV